MTGGFVYRGSDVPSLAGRYVYADYLSGTVWSIDASQEAPEPRVEAEAGFWIASFAEGRSGEIYAINWTQVEHPPSASPEGGGFYRLRPAPPAERGDFPRLLSLTGCVDPDDPTAPAPGLLPYAPRARLWSDGADKERFLSLPPGGTIGVEADGDFTLPVGTVLVKHFRVDGRYHETRLLMNHEDVGWRGYSYRWNAEQTDAELLDGAFSERLASGLFWRYPSRAGCMICHTGAAGRTLGLEAGQLVDDLEALHRDGRFDAAVTLEGLRAFAPLADPYGDAPIADRARSYLHGNCAMCHRPDAPPSTEIDLRYATPFGDQALCGVVPTRGTVGVTDPAATLFTPGAPELSILLVRMRHPGTARMPPLGSEIVDAEGNAVVEEWIEATTACP